MIPEEVHCGKPEEYVPFPRRTAERSRREIHRTAVIQNAKESVLLPRTAVAHCFSETAAKLFGELRPPQSFDFLAVACHNRFFFPFLQARGS